MVSFTIKKECLARAQRKYTKGLKDTFIFYGGEVFEMCDAELVEVGYNHCIENS
jgi:hypothetical protein